MQKRAVVVCAAAAVLALAAAVLGFAAEHFKNQAFVSADVFQCEYRRTPALGFGILAALLTLAAAALVTAASGCFGCCGGASALPADRRRGCARTCCATVAWLLVAEAVVSFLYGASRNTGGTGGFTAIRRPPGRDGGSGGTVDIVCNELKDGVFVSASVTAAIGIACAVTAYVDALQQRNRARTATLGVAMGQPNNPTPVAYPAQPAYGGGHGAKQPGETVA